MRVLLIILILMSSSLFAGSKYVQVQLKMVSQKQITSYMNVLEVLKKADKELLKKWDEELIAEVAKVWDIWYTKDDMLDLFDALSASYEKQPKVFKEALKKYSKDNWQLYIKSIKSANIPNDAELRQ